MRVFALVAALALAACGSPCPSGNQQVGNVPLGAESVRATVPYCLFYPSDSVVTWRPGKVMCNGVQADACYVGSDSCGGEQFVVNSDAGIPAYQKVLDDHVNYFCWGK